MGNLLWCALVFAAFGFSVCLHEFGHAIVAYWGGDRTVKDKGYLTLNPLRYTDATTSLILPLIFLLMGGIPLPGAAVYINQSSLKNRAWKSAVSAAGPIATILVTLVLASVITTVSTANTLLYEGLALLLTLEIASIFLNLLPVPGLDGFGIISPWLPDALQAKIRPVRKYGIWILFALFWTVPDFSRGFWGSVSFVSQYLGVSSQTFALSLSRFQAGASILFLVLLAILIGYKQWEKRQPGYIDPARKALYAEENLRAALTNVDQKLAAKETVEDLHVKTAILLHLKQYEEALTTVERAITLRTQSDFVETEITRNNLLFLKGSAHFYQQHYKESLVVFDEILSNDPDNKEVAYNKACCHARLGQVDQGIAALTQALSGEKTTLHSGFQADEDLAPLRVHPSYASLTQ